MCLYVISIVVSMLKDMLIRYRQAVPFLDSSVADLDFSRHNNDVFLYKYMFPMKKEHESLGVLCFLQSLSFITAELQSRLFTQVLLEKVALPSQAEKETEQTDIEMAMRAQYIDRQQLKVQAGHFFIFFLRNLSRKCV